MNEKPTPETDAVVHKYLGNEGISAKEVSQLLDKSRNLERQRDNLLAALERLSRVAAVELNTSRPDVIEQARTAIAAVKGEK